MAKFYGIGVGPGDPDLLTLKAVKILEKVDVILAPQTKKDKKGVAYSIVEPHLKHTIEIIYVDFPMVTDEEVFYKAGLEAARQVETAINLGKNVAFITLGDPSVYSTYGYILKGLNENIQVETIPGITSFCAAAAMANRALVEKDEIFSVIPMNADDLSIDNALAHTDAVAFMKIYKREARVSNHLKKHQIDDSILAVRCGFEEGTIHHDIYEKLKDNKDYLTLVLGRKGDRQ